MAIIEDTTLHMYVEESKEHLESIESDLLEIEKGGAVVDEDLVNKVFRAAHSIKGGGGFLGLDNIRELSHLIENVLDLIRNFELVPDPDLVNTVLKAFDRLGELLDDASNSNEMEIDKQVDALKAIAAGLAGGESDKKEDTQKVMVKGRKDGLLFTVSRSSLEQGRKGGKRLYILEFDMVQDPQYRDKNTLDIMNSLSEVGMILDTQAGKTPAGGFDSDTLSSASPLYVLYASVIEPDLLGTLLGLRDNKVTLIDHGDNNSHEMLMAGTEIQRNEQPAADIPEAVAAIQEEKSVPVKKQAPGKRTESSPGMKGKAENLRVKVRVLDQLMNMAGELVLARNELQQAISGGETKAIAAAGQRINLVSSGLQEAVILTRMQPVGTVFNKFNRMVRDLSRDLGKEIVLSVEGSEVELDKSIIEGLGDPLAHLVRNACDHGIEMPEERAAKAKPKRGLISLRAFHESGQVLIEIEDDGKGLDAHKLVKKAISRGLISEEQAAAMTDREKIALILLPRFSTAEQVTEVSGRGVGMDVVKTNFEQLGGQIELLSEVDRGTAVRIKIPLTLAIMPSLLVETCGERFALPQVNVGELLRIPAGKISEKIEKVGDADVLILRGELIPLLQLNNVLELSQTYYDRKTGKFRPDRRTSLADMRVLPDDEQENSDIQDEAIKTERRCRSASDVSIVVLQAGSSRFGLVVEKVHDTVEIVVKPLGRHLKNCKVYAGATIMGDGQVALILDVAGLGKMAELRSSEVRSRQGIHLQKKKAAEETKTNRQTLLLFHNGPQEYCAVPLHLVQRVEQIDTLQIKVIGGKKVIQYRGRSLPVYALEEVANVDMLEEYPQVIVVIFVVAGREVGLLAISPLDVVEGNFVLDEETLKQPGISGSVIINGQTVMMVDILGFMRALNPGWFGQGESPASATDAGAATPAADKRILLAEDSTFFRTQIKQFLELQGYSVIDREDGQSAWDYLNVNGNDIDLVVTDIEMPNMDGFELTKKIKEDGRFSHLRVIALTSLASNLHMTLGEKAGIDEYQIKFDKEKLVQAIHSYLRV